MRRKLRHKTLVVLGISLSSLLVFVLTYTVWKTIFYMESEQYGLRLSQELVSFEQKMEDSSVDSAFFFNNSNPFKSFDYYPKDILNYVSAGARSIKCDSMTDIHTLFYYSASVNCHIGERPVRYFFAKDYDRPGVLIVILILAISGEVGVFYFFSYVGSLQDQNIDKTIEIEREKMILEIGAKLIHDIKKGVITQLNTLHQEFGRDLELEMLQPDFALRLKSSLTKHFQAVDFLNKYINLLTANLRGEREAHWIDLDYNQLKNYLLLIFPVSQFHEIEMDSESVSFIYRPDGSNPVIQRGRSYRGCHVPEMSFFRILKNISENFNAYGIEHLEIELACDRVARQVRLTTRNEINDIETTNGESSNLGLILIKQLLIDNFGQESRMQVNHDAGVFVLELVFPLIETKKS